jgi:hypothetical protein
MPLKTPAPASRSGGKAKSKTLAASHAKGKAPPARGKPASRASHPPEAVRVSWWSSLSAERKLDVVGAVMSVVGLLTLLILFSAQRSALTGNMLGIFRWMLGWGMYILPVALIVMGMWLILRRIAAAFAGARDRNPFIFSLAAHRHAFDRPTRDD